MNIINKGIEQGLISFDESQKFITYIHQSKKRNFTNPEEKIQAETFLNLVIEKGYPVENIVQFLSVTMGSDKKEADIVVFDVHYIVGEVLSVHINDFHFYEKGEPIYITVSINPLGELDDDIDSETLVSIPLECITKY